MTRKSKIILVSATVVVIIMVSLLWIIIDGVSYASLDPMARANRSTLIVYAVEKRVGNDESLVIQKVWKDTRQSHFPVVGTTIEIKGAFSHFKPSGVQTPDGAILFFEKEILGKSLDPSFFGYVNDGKIEGMTLDEYKKACGL